MTVLGVVAMILAVIACALVFHAIGLHQQISRLVAANQALVERNQDLAVQVQAERLKIPGYVPTWGDIVP